MADVSEKKSMAMGSQSAHGGASTDSGAHRKSASPIGEYSAEAEPGHNTELGKEAGSCASDFEGAAGENINESPAVFGADAEVAETYGDESSAVFGADAEVAETYGGESPAVFGADAEGIGDALDYEEDKVNSSDNPAANDGETCFKDATDGKEASVHTGSESGEGESPSYGAIEGGAECSPDPSDAFECDIRALFAEFPELRSAACGSVNTKRYGELRGLGLTVKEAYLAASAPRGRDNRAHMVAKVPAGARSPAFGMSSAEMEIARGIFDGLSEQEIKRLYTAVTK